MRKRIAVVLAVSIAVVGVYAGGSAGAGGSPTVKVRDNFFSPERLHVAKGTRVRFRWVDTEERHNVIKKRGPGRSIVSETTDDPGYVFKKRFRKAGRYKLICSIHPEEMIFRLRVG